MTAFLLETITTQYSLFSFAPKGNRLFITTNGHSRCWRWVLGLLLKLTDWMWLGWPYTTTLPKVSASHSFTVLRRGPSLICMSSQGSFPISDNSALSSGWPRRASKVCPLSTIFWSGIDILLQACASCRCVFQNDDWNYRLQECRHDKIRCDGARFVKSPLMNIFVDRCKPR